MSKTDLSIELVPLNELVSAPRNPKGHDLDGISASMGRHGYAEPVMRDERTGRLVAGHGRIEALERMRSSGDDPPSGVVATADSWLVPVVAGWSSSDDAAAEAYLVGSNALTTAGGWDDAGLAALLRDLALTDGGLVGTGYDDDDLAALLASAGQLPDGESAPDETNQLIHQWSIIVELDDDASQRELLARLTQEGWTCRALNT